MKRFRAINVFFIIIAICISLTAVFGGCSFTIDGGKYEDPWAEKKEERGFYYYLVASDGGPERKNHPAVSATILGLVDEEKEIDELVIPETLGGYPVNQIGKRWDALGGGKKDYNINIKNIKRIIFNHKVKLYDSENYSNYPHSVDELQNGISLIFNEKISFNSSFFPVCKLIQLNKEISVDWSTDELEINGVSVSMYGQYQSAVIFDACGGNQKTYADIVITNISHYQYPNYYFETIGTVIEEPEKPTKEGYSFVGWYTDETYETAWNFENDKVTEHMTLYAKWDKN